MRILIAEHQPELGQIWARFLERQGAEVVVAHSSDEAIRLLRFNEFDVLILELVMPDGGAITISDFVAYRHPDVPVIAVTSGSFFSDGSVFDVIPNARTLLRMPLRIDDLAALVEHYAARQPKSGAARAAAG